MIPRRPLGIGAALAVIGSAALLFSGHPLLDWPTTGLPIGTLIAGILVTSLGALPLAIAPTHGASHRFAIATFALAAVWLPLSLLLAGNGRLNFAGGVRAEWASALGLLTLAAIASGIALAVAARLHDAWRSRRRQP